MAIKDTDGNELEVGAMYCCAFQREDGEKDYGQLVRYIGSQNVFGDCHPVFADADEWDGTVCDFDCLVRQQAGVIDPKTKGW